MKLLKINNAMGLINGLRPLHDLVQGSSDVHDFFSVTEENWYIEYDEKTEVVYTYRKYLPIGTKFLVP